MKYIINENQYKLLKEYMQDGFSLETLDRITALNSKYMYCKKYLGDPVGEGQSRAVFDIDEETVLKLNINGYAYNANKVEWNNIAKLSQQFDIFPKYYQYGHNFDWITCESVLPMEMSDCEYVLDIPYCENSHNKEFGWNPDYERYIVKEVCENVTLEGFIWWAENRSFNKTHFLTSIYQLYQDYTSQVIRELNTKYMALMKGKNGKWFTDLYNYIIKGKGFGDLHRGNFGLTKRNGKEVIVIIDSADKEY